MIKRLQADEQVDESRLARLEFGFLHILGEHTLRAHTLERLLARDPTMFVDEFESDDIDRGFAIGLFNLSGPYWKGIYDGGQQERELAASYERYAKACGT